MEISELQTVSLILIMVISVSAFLTFNISAYSQSEFPTSNSQNVPTQSNITTLSSGPGANEIINYSRPLTPNIIQFNLENDTSGQSANEPQIFALYGNGITAASAIAGGIIGSFLSFRYNRKIEEGKYEQNKQLEEAKYEQTKRLEEEHNSRVREIVLSELVAYVAVLTSFLQHVTEEGPHKATVAAAKSLIKNQRVYLDIPIDKRAGIFSLESVSKIERAYAFFYIFCETYDSEYERFKLKQLSAENLKYILNTTLQMIADAISSLSKKNS
jgi:hypothetical protein